MISQTNYLLHHGMDYCQQWMPRSEYRDLYESLICGRTLNYTRRAIFIDTGLIHLMVVSGAHLHFFEAWMKWLPLRLRLSLLALYCWLTGWGPPVVRAWFRRVSDLVLKKPGASVLQIEIAVILIVVLLIPEWLFSRSFLMCWICALAIALPPLWPKWPTLSLSFLCYLLLFPFCPSAPTTILCNILITPLVGGLLFPLSVLAAVIPWLVPVADAMWRLLLLSLSYMPVAPPAPILIFSKFLFLYPLLLHASLLAAEVPWRRVRAFSC